MTGTQLVESKRSWVMITVFVRSSLLVKKIVVCLCDLYAMCEEIVRQ